MARRLREADRSTEPLLRFLLQAGTLAPRSYLSLDEADRRYLQGDPQRLNRLLTAGPLAHGIPLSSAAYLTNCLSWPAPPADGLEPPVPDGWRAPSTFPTLVLAGELDDVTSVAEARQVTQRFPRSHLCVVPNRGHVSSLYFPFRSPAVGEIRAFIRAN